MSESNVTRKGLLSLIAAVWGSGVVIFLLAKIIWAGSPEPVVQVVHWSNGHLMRTGSGLRLLEQMAAEFNKAGYRTDSGKLISVKVLYYGSWELAADLLSRVTRGVPVDRNLPNPTIVTPSASHWLVTVNQAAGRTVVDLTNTDKQSIARTYIGIVTYRDMAECLGWPQKEIGYSDIIALRDDPRGWASYPCAKAEWGQRPLVVYTDPTTSDTGRSVLFSLYSIAAGKRPEQLTVADVKRPEVVGYVKGFQSLIDHYMIATRVANTKAYQGPRFGHFFLMPEDNLIHLYDGTEPYYDPITGQKGTAPPIQRPMVMIYPKEGSMARDNGAFTVDALWVSEEQKEAADEWVAFLRKDEQQRSFMAAGFRPGTSLSLSDPASKIDGKQGLDPTKPKVVISPERMDPAVAMAIDQSWGEVKRPGIVTLVVDTSGSMAGEKLQQAKDGLIRFTDNTAKNNRVGLVTFSDAVSARVPVAPLAESRFAIADAARKLQSGGQTALFDAVKAGIEMTDAAAGDENAIRAVVVLTDGRANRGETRLDGLVEMMSRNEKPIGEFRGFENDSVAVEYAGQRVGRQDVVGAKLALKTRHPIQIFFIGIGKDADMQVGRVLAEATGAESQGTAEKDLAAVLEEFSKYF
ncbi:MAG: VWA domain-containing protein [Chloroflexi bacterium]|nr:VWA domain-containing protein [Chloroflexota bacterium]